MFLSYLKKAFSPRLPYLQVMFVFLAFGLMVFSSYLFGRNLEREHLDREAEDLFFNIEAQLNSDMQEIDTMLGVVSETIGGMLVRGFDFDEVKAYVTQITEYGRVRDRVAGFITVHVYLDIFGGVTYNGLGISGVPGYVAQERPWYKAAETAVEGETVVTEPYIDAAINEITTTFVRNVYDDDGHRIAIVSIDILLDRIYKFSSERRRGSNLWMLLDSNLTFIAHPNTDFLGMSLRDSSSGLAVFADDLKQGIEVSGRRFVSYGGETRIITIRQIENGWYLGVATPVDVYNDNLKNVQLFFIMLGLFLATGLSAILIRIVSDKNRAEWQTQIMFDSMPLSANYWTKDYKNIRTNEEVKKLFDISDKQEYLDRFFEFSPEFQPDGERSSEKALVYIRKAFYEGYYRFEWMHQKLNGEPVPCEITLVRIKNNDEYAVLGYMRDLREEKALQAKMFKAEALKQVMFEAHQNLQTILDMLPIAVRILAIDDGILLYANNEWLRTFNCTSFGQQVAGHASYEFMPEVQPDGRKTKDVVNEMYRTDTAVAEIQCFKRGGQPFLARISTCTINYEGRRSSLAVIEDMTAEIEHKKMLENTALKEQEANLLKSRFLAAMSHEIRTPMNAILGIAEMQLQDEDHPQDVEEAFITIFDSGNLLLNIINDILDFSKIEAGKLEVIPYRYDIPSLINDTVQINRLRYENTPIDFKLNIDENMPLDLFGDELRIKQILNNLLSNAYKYSSNGLVELAVTFEPLKDDDVTLVLRVTDTGQGMTEEQISKLFEEYTRFNPEINRAVMGTGLGMSITKQLVEIMNGNIAVESEAGKGSVFTVRIPQKRIGERTCGADLADKLQEYRLNNLAKSKKRQFVREYMPYGKVLIVDDVESNLYVARAMLHPYGLVLDTAMSGQEAIDRIKDGNLYDVIFMDHMMPIMDGIETVKNMRSMGYDRPIIALTANAVIGQSEIFLQNGFDGYISKPVDSRELNIILNEFIRDRQPPEVIEKARQEKAEKRPASAHKAFINDEFKKVFARDIEKAVNVLEMIYPKLSAAENIADIDEDELNKYKISVHGMKSILLDVGETELSSSAYKLEQAGRSKDIDIMINDIPKFMAALKKVLLKFKSPEEETPDTDVELTEEDKKYLCDKLLSLKTACDSFDKDQSKNVLTELKQKTWPGIIVKELDGISENLLHSAFKKASAAADRIMADYTNFTT